MIEFEKKVTANFKIVSRISVKVESNYNDAFVEIFNNVNENTDLLNVSNNNKNDIFVTCKSEAEQDTKEWLENFGYITKVDYIYAVCIDGYQVGSPIDYKDHIIVEGD